MKDSFLESSAAFVGPVGSEGGRSPSTLSPRTSASREAWRRDNAGALGASAKWCFVTARRIDKNLSRELGVPSYSAGALARAYFIGDRRIVARARRAMRKRKAAAAMKRIGELRWIRNSMQKLAVGMLALWPGGRWRYGYAIRQTPRRAYGCCVRL